MFGERKYSDQQIARIQALTDESRTASYIADVIYQEFGRETSRNAIIGLWNRKTVINPKSGEYRQRRGARSGGLVNRIKGKLGLLKRNGWRGYGYGHGEYKPKPPKLTLPKADDKARVSIFDLTNDSCRWPVGEPGKDGFGYCGLLEADHANGKPYCPGHQARARVPKSDARSKGRRSVVVFLEAAE